MVNGPDDPVSGRHLAEHVREVMPHVHVTILPDGIGHYPQVEAPALVLIHDCARPFVSPQLIARGMAAARTHGAAVPGLAVTDTIKQVNASGLIEATPDRARLRAVQTPQAFRFELILAAHRKAAEAGRDDMTDDGAVAEWAGLAVHVFEGEAGNMKVTTPQDFATAQARIGATLSDYRTGQGFDVHAFTTGDHVCLGGVAIPHDKALLGHSDADVLMHAVTDALYGALADGDIGAHFPPSDPQWKGAASDIFLRHAAQRVRERGGMIAHVDATVICEAPKVGPHRDRIRAKLAEIMGIDVSRVAVKATTSEELGFTGRREGIATMALASVRLPE
jgi:2-C-methyl-D-erythritol 4-phosphate cytidylyltransferase/2-C-methyl-D-erythritol 2,4-cyclodiphosphate synthase